MNDAGTQFEIAASVGRATRKTLARFLRNVLVLLVGATAVLYVAVFVLLLIFQRQLVFVGNTRIIPPPQAGSIYRAATISENDGTRLTIWKAPPARPGLPTFVIFHGNGSSLTDFAGTGERLHAQGFGVVLAAYRGYSGNSGSPSEDGLMADARAVLAGVPRPVVLWGHSLGSGVAARMAAEGRAAALILESPYTSVPDVAARRFPIYPARYFLRDRFDTLSLVPEIRVPVLIIHGTRDRAVPYDMGVTLAKRFGRQATFISIIGAGHEPHRSDLVPFVMRWLQRNDPVPRP
jgi:pimeloyl-ACP methyl ester carboxylesterase